MADQNLTVFQKLTRMFGFPGQTRPEDTPSFNFSKDHAGNTRNENGDIDAVKIKNTIDLKILST